MERLGHAVIEKMQQEIAAAGGNEVFFAGLLGSQGMERVQVLARGNKFSVPAVSEQLQPGMMVIHNHPGGNLTPSPADISVAARLGQDGIGFAIINNSVTKIYVVVEPLPEEHAQIINHSEIDAVLSEGGSVAQRLEGFQSRPQQLAMARTICNALNDGMNVIVEAATGTGKSLAYLVPTLLWAQANAKRVVISTNTINLQEQLIYKDIPLLQKSVPGFKAVLVKGRGNYLCVRKLREVVREGAALVEEADLPDLQSLMPWAETTADGSKADLGFNPRTSLWELISSEGDTCLRLNCPEFRKCYFHRARREALDAQLLVVNHHLLFADISLRAQGVDSGVLPSYHCIVLDEAHNVEDVATTWFGKRITQTGISRLLSRLYSTKGPKVRGILPILERKLLAALISQENAVMIRARDLAGTIARAQESIRYLFSLSEQLVGAARGEIKVRLTSKVTACADWQRVAGQAELVLSNINAVTRELVGLQKGLEDLGPAVFEELLSQAVELDSVIKRLVAVGGALSELVFEDKPERVRWLETYKVYKETRVAFVDAPLTVAESLQAEVWKRVRTTVLTSATLAVDGDFSFVRQRLGLDESLDISEQVYSSPFDYQSGVLLGVPTDIPTPDADDFPLVIARAITESLQATRGRALVLFTSFSLLRKTAESIAPSMVAADINMFIQGEMPRHQLLNMFRADVHSVLLATASFWEGVDVVGESLSSLILTRLPFTVPDDPITQARMEKLRAQGQNPFYSFQMPQAVLRFKQGFGRLIRSNNDRGVVLILDRRVHSKKYGQQFLKALPPCPQLYQSLEKILARQLEFLGSANSNRQ